MGDAVSKMHLEDTLHRYTGETEFSDTCNSVDKKCLKKNCVGSSYTFGFIIISSSGTLFK